MTALVLARSSLSPWPWQRKGLESQSSAAFTRSVEVVPPRNPELAGYGVSAWVESTQRQLEEVQKLNDGWDGYRAGPIRRDVICFAEAVLNQIMRPQTPAPHIAPMASSGLMMEWHTNGIDLEIEIEEPGSLWASFEDDETKQEKEHSLASNLAVLQTLLDTITTRALQRMRSPKNQ